MWNQFFVFQLVHFFLLGISKTNVTVSVGHTYLKYALFRNLTELYKEVQNDRLDVVNMLNSHLSAVMKDY